MDIMNAGLARDIVERMMRIIPFNVNVMDAHGVILASGEPGRVGEQHDGALLALARRQSVEIDAASARHMHGARPGVNLPLTVNGQICGAVGLSGEPDEVRRYGQLVQLTAEMILEQAGLASELQRDSRYREAFVLNLIRYEAASRSELEAWGKRLGLDFARVQAVFLLELQPDEAGGDRALDEIQRLQLRLLARQPDALTATVGPCEMVVVDSFDAGKKVDAMARRRLQALAALMQEECRLPFTLAMGIARAGVDGASISYQSAKHTARLGRHRQPHQRYFSYYDLALPVLLSGLASGWQAEQLQMPIARIDQDKNREMLRQTLDTWFSHNENASATASALNIHRNTLDYRLRRIAELTGLDLARSEDRLLLYVSTLLSAAIAAH
jgi:carbohydrate diacid regulator